MLHRDLKPQNLLINRVRLGEKAGAGEAGAKGQGAIRGAGLEGGSAGLEGGSAGLP